MAKRTSFIERRARVFGRDRYRCVYCGAPFPVDALTLDHVEPRMRGGDDSEGNLVTACSACNALKAGRAAWSFLATRPDMRQNFLRAVEESDPSFAQPVWARLVKAVVEEVERGHERQRARH